MNVLRVRGAKALHNAQLEADQGNYDKGQNIINEMCVQIDQAQPSVRTKL